MPAPAAARACTLTDEDSAPQGCRSSRGRVRVGAYGAPARGDGWVAGCGGPRRRAGHVRPMQMAGEMSLAGMGPTAETGDSAGGRTLGSDTVGHQTGAVDAGGGGGGGRRGGGRRFRDRP